MNEKLRAMFDTVKSTLGRICSDSQGIIEEIANVAGEGRKPETHEIVATLCKVAQLQAQAEIARDAAFDLGNTLEEDMYKVTNITAERDDLRTRNFQLEAQLRQAVAKGFVPDATNAPNKYELEVAKHNKIMAIKELRTRTGLGLQEAKTMIEAHCGPVYVSAS